MSTQQIPLATLFEELDKYNRANPSNPMDIRDYSRDINRLTGLPIAQQGIDAGWWQRTVHGIDRPFLRASSHVGSSIRGGVEEHENPLIETLARGGELAVAAVPSMIATGYAAMSPSRRARLMKSLFLTAPYATTSAYNQSADRTNALLSGGSLAAAPGVTRMATRNMGPLSTAATSYGIGALQDATEILSMPHPEADTFIQRIPANFRDFYGDPRNVGALALANVPSSAVGQLIKDAQIQRAIRDEHVRQAPGLYVESGEAINIKRALETEYSIEVPAGVPDNVIRNAFQTAKTGNVPGAQRAVLNSVRDRLDDRQKLLLEDSMKSERDRLKEYTKKLDRDHTQDTSYADEITFSFKSDKAMQRFMKNPDVISESDKMRAVGDQVFYWGDNPAVLQAVSRKKRRNEVVQGSLSIDRAERGVFANPALGQLARLTAPRVNKQGQELPAALVPNKEGVYKTEQVFKLLSNVLPKDIVQHYQESLPADIKFTKDNLFEVFDAMTPRIEVKKLRADEDFRDEAEFAALIRETQNLSHALETEGYYYKVNSTRAVLFKTGLDEEVSSLSEVPESVRLNFERILELKEIVDRDYSLPFLNLRRFLSDSATARYTQVNPLPLDQMDRPVDILVRQQGEEKYKHSHFGDSDVNVLGSVRGYFSDPTTFFVFEVQSDWGQTVKKEEKQLQTYADAFAESVKLEENNLRPGLYNVEVTFKVTPNSSPVKRKVAVQWSKEGAESLVAKIKSKDRATVIDILERYHFDHHDLAIGMVLGLAQESSPLLARYEKLALQAAIEHAKENGASRIVLPDAETAMMIEGHDRTYVEYGGPYQTEQMAKDKVADLKAKGYADAFYKKEPEGWIVPPVYARAAQEGGMRWHYGPKGSLVSAMKKLGAKPLGEVNLGEMTNRDPSDYFGGKDDITGFLFDISNVETDSFTLYNKQREAVESSALLKNESLSEILRIQHDAAERGGQIMTTQEFVQMLREQAEVYGTDFDPGVVLRALSRINGLDRTVQAFQADRRADGTLVTGFSKADKVYINLKNADHVKALRTLAHEATHTSLYDLARIDGEAYERLVSDINSIDARMFSDMIHEANRMFGTDIDAAYASGQRFTSQDTKVDIRTAEERLAAVADLLMAADLQAHQTGRSSKMKQYFHFLPTRVQRFLQEVFDKIASYFVSPARYGDLMTPASRKIFVDMTNRLQTEMKRSEKAVAKQREISQRMQQLDPQQLLAPSDLPLSRLDLEQGNFEGSKDLYKELNFVEQPKLTRSQKYMWSGLAITKRFPVARDLFETLHNFRGNIQKTLMQYMSELGQNAEGTLSHDITLRNTETWIQDVAQSETRLKKLGNVFEADQQRRKPGDTPGVETGLVTREEMIKDFNLSEVDADMVLKIRQMVSRVAYQEFLDMSHAHWLQLATVLQVQNPNLAKADAEGLARTITQKANEPARALLIGGEKTGIEKKLADRDAAVAQEMLAEHIAQVLGVEKTSSQVRNALELSVSLAQYRMKHVATTSREGYAPQVRRGNYILRYNELVDGEKVPRVRGFKTEHLARKWWSENAIEGNLTDEVLTDKASTADHYRHYTSASLQEIRRQFSKEIRTVVERAKEGVDPEAAALLDNIVESLGDMDTELSNALGTKADPFKMRRKDIGGFQTEDYLPNLFDYLNVKTIIGQKAITAARAKFEMAQPEFFKNKDLLRDMRERTDYTLNSNQSEFTPGRKFVFAYFLADSIRHYMQNITQPYVIGVPELASVTRDPIGAPGRLIKGYALVRRWNMEGTTGNAQLDRLMKQAEHDRVWNPSMLQHYLPTQELETGGNELMNYFGGTSGLGRKAKVQGVKAMNAVRSMFQVTAETSEILNRQASFVARIAKEIEQKNLSTEQLQELFTEASRFSHDVNFVGDKSNRPGFIRNSGIMHGPLMFSTALMSFVMNHISLLAAYKSQLLGGKTLRQYIKNPHKIALDNPGLYGLVMSVFTIASVAGLMGIPFSHDANEAFEDLFGIRPSDAAKKKMFDVADLFGLAEEHQPAFVDAIMYGFPGAAGIGTSQSIGLGRIFSVQADRPFSFWDLLGASGGVGQRLLRGADALTDGPSDPANWNRAFRKSAPAAVNQWIQFADMLEHNRALDTEGRVVSNRLDAGANVSRLLGFTPLEVTKTRESEFRVDRMTRRSNQQRVTAARTIGRHVLDYKRTGDEDALRRGRAEYLKFVQDKRLTVAERQSLIQSIAADILKRSDFLIDMPLGEVSDHLASVQRANPRFEPGVTSALNERRTAFSVARTLGDPVAVNLAQPAPDWFRRQAVYEQLIQAGVPAPIAHRMAQGDLEAIAKQLTYEVPSVRPSRVAP